MLGGKNEKQAHEDQPGQREHKTRIENTTCKLEQSGDKAERKLP